MNKQKLDTPSDALWNVLAAERGINASIFTYLGARGLVTDLQGCPAFPVLNAVGERIVTHVHRMAAVMRWSFQTRHVIPEAGSLGLAVMICRRGRGSRGRALGVLFWGLEVCHKSG